jgi:coiled-coil domain-containing protein 130
MKAPCCGQEIEIQTDPKNCEYKVISGAVQKTVTYDEVEAESMLLPEPGGKSRQLNIFSFYRWWSSSPVLSLITMV